MDKLDPKDIENILSLTPMQEGLLFHYLKEPHSSLYFEQLSLQIGGEIDHRTFEHSYQIRFHDLVKRKKAGYLNRIKRFVTVNRE